jgi:putative protease
MATHIPELLAPAGGPEQLRAGLAAGADAFYLGLGHHFNARRGAASFDDESFAQGCRLAHLAGARVYVTTNVVVKQDELARALALVRRAWLLGADAFIIQDWGLLAQIRRLWPQIEIHVSTQANVHDVRGVQWCRDVMGVARVTLSRELSLDEYARISATGVETEGFGHGALCFCYSGVCHLSQMRGRRSANRGACAQPCRLPYRLLDEDGTELSPADVRPLCPKDMCTAERLGEMAAAGVGSLKIEGRLKGSDYVYPVVRAYRSALDELAGDVPSLDADERARVLKRAFNRDFTSAYLDGRSGNELMSFARSNNRGELVGEVLAARDLGEVRVWRGGEHGGRERVRKHRVAEVDVRLHAPVGAGDLLEIRPKDDPSQFLTTTAACDAAAGEAIVCRCARPLPAGSEVRVIRSQSAIDDGERASRADIPRARDVRVRVVARLGHPFEVELACADGAATARAEGFVVEPARTRAVREEDLVAHVGRFGGSAFRAVSFEVELDEGCGLRFSDVHKVRAEACRALEAALLAPYAARTLPPVPSERSLAQAIGEQLARAASVAQKEAAAQGSPLASGPACHPDSCDQPDPYGHPDSPSHPVHPCLPEQSEASPADVASLLEANGVAVSDEQTLRTVHDGCSSAEAPELCALVATPAQAAAARRAGATCLYATEDALRTEAWGEDMPLPWLDEICREADHARQDEWVRAGQTVAVGNVSQLALAAEQGAVAEIRPCIPVHNTAAIAALAAAGARAVWLSSEVSLEEATALAQASPIPLGVVAYGRPRAMTSEHCVLQVAGQCIHDCARCELRRRALVLEGVHDDFYPVRTDLQGRSRIYSFQPTDLAPEVGELLAAGVARFLVDGTLLGEDELARAVAHIGDALRAAQEGAPAPARWQGHTAGHLHNPID